MAWLTAASFFFFAWWNPLYLSLLLASIVFNNAVGIRIAHGGHGRGARDKRAWLTLGIAIDLLALGYFKYTNFFLEISKGLLETNPSMVEIVLPLGISFFTFTQIAFLVDAYHGKVDGYGFLEYCLFVTFFPHLIAGPILHHREIIPQFLRPSTYRWDDTNAALGFTIFFVGLFKKTVLADGIAPFVSPVFDAAARGEPLTLLECWIGALSYTMQIYFDFSGYSDMAIGAAHLFGIRLPLNFHSPYKAPNIIDFWRRWHMTLSRFLREYLYIPLGGNRRGAGRRHVNIMATMLLGGLWHGAGWTFVAWGALHGAYLMINHAWHTLRRRLGHDLGRSTRMGRAAGGLLTFLAVVVAWVFFRAPSIDAALHILDGMIGRQGVALPERVYVLLGNLAPHVSAFGVQFRPLVADDVVNPSAIVQLAMLFAIAWLAPNTQQITARFEPAASAYAGDRDIVPEWLRWSPTPVWVALLTCVVALIAITSIIRVSEFLYFQF